MRIPMMICHSWTRFAASVEADDTDEDARTCPDMLRVLRLRVLRILAAVEDKR